jgi:hypothetical protein
MRPVAPIAILLLAFNAAGARLAPPATNPGSIPAHGDEFVGPFPSWSNVRVVYGASGDGMADDGVAIQHALNELGAAGHSPVLYFPHGTYRITKPLALASNINVALVGEDPATTTIVWGGDAGGTMLSLNGVAYSRFARLTFDGRRRASVAVEQSWDNLHPHFDTGNEYSDLYFVDTEYGIHGGFKGHGFAETSIRRSHFVRSTKAGVALGNFNALDVWIWYSTFDDCQVAVTNNPGAGNFHVYNSVFRRSALADVSIGNTGGFSLRGNYSTGSRAFFVGNGTNNPATIDVESNTIVDPTESTPIRLGNQGPGLIMDNTIKSLSTAAGPAISWSSFFDADMTSVGNVFTVPSPIKVDGRWTSVDDRVVSRGTLNPIEPDLPKTPPNLGRQIFEVPPGSDGSEIQAVILGAARQNGRRPVVHIQYGSYSISDTLTIPAGDIQIVGDGSGTLLQWTGARAGPVLRFPGPSRSTLRDIQVDGAANADAILIENVDQPGSRVYMDQAQLRAAKQSDLFVDALDEANVQLEDIGFAYSQEGVAIKVTGGPRSAAGIAAAGRTNIFSAASSANRMSIDVSGGAQVLVRDAWYESSSGEGFAAVHDRATFTIEGSRISSPANRPRAAVDIRDLTGRVSILATHIDDRIAISGDGSRAAVFGLGIYAEQKTSNYFVNAASPRARDALVNSRQLSIVPGIRSAPTPNVGNSDPAFIREMLSHARREHPAPLTARPDGVSDVRLFRVWVANGLNGITLAAGSRRVADK